MNQGILTLFISLKVLFTRIFKGSVHFSKEFAGKTLLMEDGKEFHIFRDLKIVSHQNLKNTSAIFIVRFKFSGLSLAVNRRLSIIPAPFLIAKLGFRRKMWTVSEDGYFQGIYQWASKESAESYPQSFIFKIMTKRAKIETVSYEIIPDMYLKDYIDCLFTM